MGSSTVLVTGGTGFVGAHCAVRLLNKGYQVRTTVRTAALEPEVRDMVRRGGGEPLGNLAVVEADLMSDKGWAEATAGCDFVLHVASPFPPKAPKHENEVVVPAREGTLRVLRAARDAGVKRTVLTSSFAAVGYGRRSPDRDVFTEDNWSDDGDPLIAYTKSKTLAERAAWNYFAEEEGSMELSVINPVGIFGPNLGKRPSVYVDLVRQLMNGSMPLIPRVTHNIIDVRDVADLHIHAMTHPDANGQRFVATAGLMSFKEISDLVRGWDRKGGGHVRGVAPKEIPDWLVRLIGRFDARTAQLVPDLGSVRPATGDKALRVLSWQPRISAAEAVLASARSLIDIDKEISTGEPLRDR